MIEGPCTGAFGAACEEHTSVSTYPHAPAIMPHPGPCSKTYCLPPQNLFLQLHCMTYPSACCRGQASQPLSPTSPHSSNSAGQSPVSSGSIPAFGYPGQTQTIGSLSTHQGAAPPLYSRQQSVGSLQRPGVQQGLRQSGMGLGAVARASPGAGPVMGGGDAGMIVNGAVLSSGDFVPGGVGGAAGCIGTVAGLPTLPRSRSYTLHPGSHLRS